MVVPDLIEPIIGWRAWYLGGGQDGLSLFSVVHHHDRWPAGFAFEAGCAHDHEAPDDACECGIYASAEPEGALAYVPLRAQMVPARARANTILGRVALWGKVRQGPDGLRGQYAYPEHLYLPACFALDPELTAEHLAALYDVPAEVVPALGSIFVEAP
jgi:hypothetical protein